MENVVYERMLFEYTAREEKKTLIMLRSLLDVTFFIWEEVTKIMGEGRSRCG